MREHWFCKPYLFGQIIPKPGLLKDGTVISWQHFLFSPVFLFSPFPLCLQWHWHIWCETSNQAPAVYSIQYKTLHSIPCQIVQSFLWYQCLSQLFVKIFVVKLFVCLSDCCQVSPPQVSHASPHHWNSACLLPQTTHCSNWINSSALNILLIISLDYCTWTKSIQHSVFAKNCLPVPCLFSPAFGSS